jgi:hypothetical protein
MKKGTGNREHGTENLAAMLRNASSPVDEDAEPNRDLWPEMRARLNQQSDVASRLRSVPWFDWALAGGVAVFAVAFPVAVPVLLYYL